MTGWKDAPLVPLIILHSSDVHQFSELRAKHTCIDIKLLLVSESLTDLKETKEISQPLQICALPPTVNVLPNVQQISALPDG